MTLESSCARKMDGWAMTEGRREQVRFGTWSTLAIQTDL